MAYVAWSVSFGEQPSAAKWNILGSNDASFADGTGISAGAIGATQLAAGAVTSAKLAPTVYATDSFIGSGITNTSYATITTQSVTMAASGKVLVQASMSGQLSSGAPAISWYGKIYVDGVGQTEHRNDAWVSNASQTINCIAYTTHAAGTFNITLQAKVGGGTFTIWDTTIVTMVLAA